MTYYVSGREHSEWALFLHAAFVSHEMFRAQAEYFKDKYNLLLPDLLGHGQSTNAKRGDSIDKTARWLWDILQAEQIEKVHVVGVSLGAVLAQDFANRYPGAVKSLACFGGYDINHFDPETQKENGASQLKMMAKAMISVKWFAESNKKISAFTPRAQEEFYEMNLRFPKKSFRYLASLGGMINRRQTERRDYPLLIGCGRHDIPSELSLIEQWKNREPDCKTVIFENAGHCVNLDAPQEFNRTLEKFWQGTEKGQPQPTEK